MPETESTDHVKTGIAGLDYVLKGGLPPNRLYLVEGHAGSGKTTLALQYLLAGIQRGEACMYVTLVESEHELRSAAESHGWNLDGIHIMEIIAPEESLSHDARYTMYHPAEVELAATTRAVLAEAARIKPARLVFDSLSELRLLAEDALRYRRQILALKQYFARQKCTVLFIDDRMGPAMDMHLHSLAHGVISLERHEQEYGAMRRRLVVDKLRSRAFHEGFHDFVIREEGILLFPRIVVDECRAPFHREAVKSGLEALDALMGGGPAKGTSTLILGPAGTGKSSLAAQYAHAAASRGEHAAFFLFDESLPTFLERSKGLGLDMAPLIEAGRASVRQVKPAELSPGEFAHAVRHAGNGKPAGLAVIDSLNGYLNATPSERFLSLHLHDLLTCLSQQGTTTLLLMTQHGFAGSGVNVPVDASYLVDNVLLLRYFEAFGEVRQAISVIKKRTGPHERTIRELRFDKGLVIGEPVREFQGVLTGAPEFVGKAISEKEKA